MEKCIQRAATPEQWSKDRLGPGVRVRLMGLSDYPPTLSTLDSSGGGIGDGQIVQ